MVPVPGGVRWVSVTATDDAGQQTLAGAMIVVAELRFSITGDLVQGTPCDITVSWTPAAGHGTVQSVTADLSMIGGPAAQPLASNGTSRSCSLTVTPVTSGFQNVGISVVYTTGAESTFGAVSVDASRVGVVRPVEGLSASVSLAYAPRQGTRR